MKILRIGIFALLVSIPFRTNAQSLESLRQDIERILSSKKAKVGVSIINHDGKETLSVYDLGLSSDKRRQPDRITRSGR